MWFTILIHSTGAVLSSTDRVLPQNRRDSARLNAPDEVADEEDEDEEVVKVLEEKGSFDEAVLWGHESTPEEGDPYVKGIEEWIAFAEMVGPMFALRGL